MKLSQANAITEEVERVVEAARTRPPKYAYETMEPALGECWQLERETDDWRVYTNESRDTVLLYHACKYDLIYEPTGTVGVRWQQVMSVTRTYYDSLMQLATPERTDR